MKPPGCYQCIYRGELPGSAHSCCQHPSLGDINSDPLLSIMAMFASVGRVAPIQTGVERINVKGNPHGISHGWFNFPFNFDPTWLEECDGFKEKE